MSTETSRASSLASWIGGWLATWLATAAAFELWVPRTTVGPRFGAHLHALALHVALAVLLAGVTAALRRFVGAPRVRLGVALALGAVLGALLVADDLRGVAEMLPGPLAVWAAVLGAVGGIAAPLGFAAAGQATRRDRRAAIPAVAMGVLVGVAHHRVLTSGYEGVHFAMAVAASALVAGALDGGTSLDGVASRTPRRALALAAIAAIVGAAGLVVGPGSDVVLLSRRLPGNAVPALAARARQVGRGGIHAAHADGAWMRDRSGLPPVAPSSPRLLPKDGVVVLVTIDAVRAEVMREPILSRYPNFKRLVEASHVFTRARSAAPHTTPSLAALMMGKYYSQVVWEQRGGKAPKPFTDRSPTIASVLAEHGVASAAYPSLGQVSEEYGLGRGFTEPAKRIHAAEKIVAAIVKRAKKGAGGGLFIYTHFMDPHFPYNGEGATEYDRYLDEIARVDRAFEPLVDLVLDSPLKDRITLIVSADHGEAFGEHESTQHGTTLYEEMMRVPLVVKIPGRPAGTSEVPVSLIDVGPTVMDLLGASTPSSFMGSSLVPVITGRATSLDRPLILESGRMMRAWIEDDRWKYIADRRHGTVELYDLQSDPDELKNLHDAQPERAARLAGLLDAFYDVHTYRAPGYQVPYFP